MSNNLKKASEKLKKANSIIKEAMKKENLKQAGWDTGKFIVGGLTGAGAGALLGKPSLLAGMGVTFLGHLFKAPAVASIGVGMIASGGYQLAAGVNGAEVGGLEGAKERMKAFGENIKQRLYLDKIIKPKKEGTNGMGEVQYFSYPQNGIDMGSLEDIEKEIQKSSERFAARQFSGEEDFSGVEERIL